MSGQSLRFVQIHCFGANRFHIFASPRSRSPNTSQLATNVWDTGRMCSGCNDLIWANACCWCDPMRNMLFPHMQSFDVFCSLWHATVFPCLSFHCLRPSWIWKASKSSLNSWVPGPASSRGQGTWGILMELSMFFQWFDPTSLSLLIAFCYDILRECMTMHDRDGYGTIQDDRR